MASAPPNMAIRVPLLGHVNIPGGQSETESAMTVSECKCGEWLFLMLCWTGVGLQANFDEEYVLLCAMLLLLV